MAPGYSVYLATRTSSSTTTPMHLHEQRCGTRVFYMYCMFLSALAFDVVAAAGGNGNGTSFEGIATTHSLEFLSLALWRRLNRLDHDRIGRRTEGEWMRMDRGGDLRDRRL
ncbi:hypothetical protein CGRA01v4_04836 [Colletotrichum graminicola]|nr:hypothetical protein CGRA01v4_04836 [Colletotrichum graminicola]